MDSAAVEELQQRDSGTAAPPRDDGTVMPGSRPRGALALKTGLYTAVVVCLVTTLVHVVMVFLHVAPSNPVSQRYNSHVNGWVYPLFEQNWRLFAPDPESFNRKVLARTARTESDGSVRVSPWFDLTAVDNSAVEHNVFPSHASQNLLRRAWSSYVDAHGGSDTARSERAVMLQKYLRNIAADRVAAQNDGGTFDFVQLRVITLPVAAPAARAENRPPVPTENRLLPWWKVTPHGK
jgi:hypothetical protein